MTSPELAIFLGYRLHFDNMVWSGITVFYGTDSPISEIS